MLGQPDHVHVAFHKHAAVDLAPSEFVQSVKLAALVEHRRFRAVHVFRLDVAHRPAAEAGDAAAAVADREHDAVAEAVVEFAGVALERQAGVDQPAAVVLRLAEARQDAVARGRVSDPEGLRDLPGQPAALEVVLGRRAGLESFDVVQGRAVQQFIQALAGGPGRTAAGHFQAVAVGQRLDCGGEVEAVVLHQEAQGAAVGAASEAVKEALGGADGERRGLFVVERAQSLVLAAGALQLDAFADDLRDVGAIEEIVDELSRNRPRHKPEYCPIRRARPNARSSFVATARPSRAVAPFPLEPLRDAPAGKGATPRFGRRDIRHVSPSEARSVIV